MQHPAKGPGQGGGGGGCCSLPEERSSCLERNCFALPFTKGNAREANSAARCHMDTKCSPLAPPACAAARGGLLLSPSSLSCPELPQLLQTHLSHTGQLPGFRQGGQVLGGWGTLGPPLSLSPFPASCMALLFGAITSWLHKNSNLWQKDAALGFHCK